MYIVPLAKDTIHTKDGNDYIVVEYTNYKEGGPAVYCKNENKDVFVVYFFDISRINGTAVDYVKNQKIFKAHGKVKRLFDLPQPDDGISVNNINKHEWTKVSSKLQVSLLKLKSKSLGINKGLMVKDEEGNYHRLKDITNIERALGSSEFNQSEYYTYYKDYMGV